MKQTEFRGKRVGGGEWVYGDLLHDKDGRPHIVPKGQELDFDDDMFEIYEVEPATVGQYSGLKDKNGREICEGDIVRWNEYIGEAIFKSGMFARKVKNVSASLSSLLLATEVIGNIHDNPELLKTE